MRSENSVVTALAELGRMEQERVEGERRRAAEQRVRRLEQALAQDASERIEREVAAASARLQSEHAAREGELRARVASLESELIAALAGERALREAMAGHETSRARPARRGAIEALCIGLACAFSGWTMVQNSRLTDRLQDAERVARTVHAAAVPAPARTESSATAITVRVPDATASGAQGVKPADAVNHKKPEPPRTKHASKTQPKTDQPKTDPLGEIACDEDDPMCGL